MPGEAARDSARSNSGMALSMVMEAAARGAFFSRLRREKEGIRDPFLVRVQWYCTRAPHAKSRCLRIRHLVGSQVRTRQKRQPGARKFSSAAISGLFSV